MSEIKHQIEAGDDDVVVETKNKEAMEENYAGEGTGIPNKRDGIGSPVKRAENIASSVKKEDNRRKSSDFWLLWPEPSARATMARVSCFFHISLLILLSGRWAPSPAQLVHQAGPPCGAQPTRRPYRRSPPSPIQMCPSHKLLQQ